MLHKRKGNDATLFTVPDTSTTEKHPRVPLACESDRTAREKCDAILFNIAATTAEACHHRTFSNRCVKFEAIKLPLTNKIADWRGVAGPSRKCGHRVHCTIRAIGCIENVNITQSFYIKKGGLVYEEADEARLLIIRLHGLVV
ncbi:hypothetical protein BGZ61DRAFT_472632 [Ilyonectria robusta]|uniref:uncharacterized protein n=1 Tax=Ilyonectria robusta TaxID=1079257 RepID=UPI001E8CD241|nr:uncharacterized protein BGZ61DRAFT_472632 [Ilyonectria robusta]KAH8736286.1 hypothetical protein BGZ61DRAFT_472632 [Ilyonectria robusta]